MPPQSTALISSAGSPILTGPHLPSNIHHQRFTAQIHILVFLKPNFNKCASHLPHTPGYLFAYPKKTDKFSILHISPGTYKVKPWTYKEKVLFCFYISINPKLLKREDESSQSHSSTEWSFQPTGCHRTEPHIIVKLNLNVVFKSKSKVFTPQCCLFC